MPQALIGHQTLKPTPRRVDALSEPKARAEPSTATLTGWQLRPCTHPGLVPDRSLDHIDPKQHRSLPHQTQANPTANIRIQEGSQLHEVIGVVRALPKAHSGSITHSPISPIHSPITGP